MNKTNDEKLILLVPIVLTFNLVIPAQQKTQAYLGLKSGGEWVWVTRESGKQQYEYKGGEFKPVESLKMDPKHRPLFRHTI